MPKPHLVSYRERIAIDGTPVDETTFAAAVERVLPALDRVAAPPGPPPALAGRSLMRARGAGVGAPLRRAGPRQAYRAVVVAAGWDGIVVDARTPGRRLRD